MDLDIQGMCCKPLIIVLTQLGNIQATGSSQWFRSWSCNSYPNRCLSHTKGFRLCWYRSRFLLGSGLTVSALTVASGTTSTTSPPQASATTTACSLSLSSTSTITNASSLSSTSTTCALRKRFRCCIRWASAKLARSTILCFCTSTLTSERLWQRTSAGLMKQGLTSPYKVKASRTGPTTGQHEIHGESWGVAINEAMDFILIFRHKKAKKKPGAPCSL